MAATFLAITPVSAFAANKVQLALHNANVEGWELRILRVSVLPGVTAVVGVAPSEWTLRRRVGTTVPPSGTGGIAIVPMDTNEPLKSGITAWNAPAVTPSGGTADTINVCLPQADEIKLSTLDAPTMMSLNPVDGMLLYNASALGPDGVPLTIRPNQTLELVQSATGGTGNCRVRVVFLIGGS